MTRRFLTTALYIAALASLVFLLASVVPRAESLTENSTPSVVVARGDTLSVLAADWPGGWTRAAYVNDLTNPDLLHVGDVLLVPRRYPRGDNDMSGIARLLRRAPKLRPDYQTFDMRRMRGWGHRAFWWPEDSQGICVFGPAPRPGDLVIDKDGSNYVVTDKDAWSPSDPGDQHFRQVRPYAGSVPESTFQPSEWIT